MDLEPSQEQAAILEALERLLEQHAGARRAVALGAKGEYDHELERVLSESGFADVARSEEVGPLEAAFPEQVRGSGQHLVAVVALGASHQQLLSLWSSAA